MLIMRIKGGLGNQLFQYVAAYSLARRCGGEFFLDPFETGNMTPRGFKLDKFRLSRCQLVDSTRLPFFISVIKNKYINKIFRILDIAHYHNNDFSYYLETKDEFREDFFSVDSENIYVDGYWQSPLYFNEFRADILQQLCPNYKYPVEYEKILSEITGANAVAIHVRRGDFRKDKHPFHYMLDSGYYLRAIKYMESRLVNPVFYWFSDDIEWVKNNVGNHHNYFFVSLEGQNADINELMLMKNCKHIITANSTFSWWAAWLNENQDGIVVVPEKPYGMQGMIPETWIKL